MPVATPREAEAVHDAKRMILECQSELLELAERSWMQPASEVVAEKREKIAGLAFENLEIAPLHLAAPAVAAYALKRFPDELMICSCKARKS
jgi:hypothetical protein